MNRIRISIDDYTLFKDEIVFLSDKITMTKERIIWENNSSKFRGILLGAIKSHILKKISKQRVKVFRNFSIASKTEKESTTACIAFLQELKVKNIETKEYSTLQIETYLSEFEILVEEHESTQDIKANNKLEDKEINSIFQFLKELQTIDLRDTVIQSLEILDYLEKIEVLSISENPITTLNGVENLKKLSKLFCINTNIETLDNLKNCQDLKELYCAKNQIKSLEPLSENENLVLINCRKTLITKEEVNIFLKSKPNCKVIRKGFLF